MPRKINIEKLMVNQSTVKIKECITLSIVSKMKNERKQKTFISIDKNSSLVLSFKNIIAHVHPITLYMKNLLSLNSLP